MQVTVNITQELLDQDRNKYRSCCRFSRRNECPVAIALTEAYGFKDVCVGKFATTVIKGNKVYFSRNTPKLKRWLCELDKGVNKKPTTFTLDFI